MIKETYCQSSAAPQGAGQKIHIRGGGAGNGKYPVIVGLEGVTMIGNYDMLAVDAEVLSTPNARSLHGGSVRSDLVSAPHSREQPRSWEMTTIERATSALPTRLSHALTRSPIAAAARRLTFNK